MKKLYLFIVCCILCSIAWAQKGGLVKGIAIDTLSKQPLVSATVTLLLKKIPHWLHLPLQIIKAGLKWPVC